MSLFARRSRQPQPTENELHQALQSLVLRHTPTSCKHGQALDGSCPECQHEIARLRNLMAHGHTGPTLIDNELIRANDALWAGRS